MIDLSQPTPLMEAVQSFGERSPLGIALSSAEFGQLPAEIRQRAFFSAWVESERVLAEAQKRIMQRIQLQRDALASGGRVMERGRFILEMQQLLDQLGYRVDPKKEGSIQDLASAGRLGLIWDMNLQMAQGYAEWKMGQDEDILDAFPAQELIRDFDRIERRDWPGRWQLHGGIFYGDPGPDYPLAPGRMIALKTDLIWAKISDFGSPWPPFAYGSGMGLRDIDRDEAEELGLLAQDEVLEPLDQPFLTGLKASIVGFPEKATTRLVEHFGDLVRIDTANQTIEWVGGASA